MPPPDPRSSTVSPSWRSATAVGLPQPRDASTAASGSSPRCSASYSCSPKPAVSAPTRRSGDEPPRAARQRWWTSATRSFQVGDGRELLDGGALEGEVRPLAALL